MIMKKVDEKPDLVRDDYSGAILNTNKSAYEAAVAARKRIQEDQMRLQGLAGDVDDLKRQMSEIHNLLIKLNEKE